MTEQLVTQEQAEEIHRDVQRIVREVAEEGAREAGVSVDEFWRYAWGESVPSEKQSYVDVSATSAAGEPLPQPQRMSTVFLIARLSAPSLIALSLLKLLFWLGWL